MCSLITHCYVCRYADAETLGLDVLASTTLAHPGTPLLAEVLSTLSTVCTQRGRPADLDAAEQYAKQGLDLVTKTHGAKSLEAAALYTTLAAAQQRLARCVTHHFEDSVCSMNLQVRAVKVLCMQAD